MRQTSSRGIHFSINTYGVERVAFAARLAGILAACYWHEKSPWGVFNRWMFAKINTLYDGTPIKGISTWNYLRYGIWRYNPLTLAIWLLSQALLSLPVATCMIFPLALLSATVELFRCCVGRDTSVRDTSYAKRSKTARISFTPSSLLSFPAYAFRCVAYLSWGLLLGVAIGVLVSFGVVPFVLGMSVAADACFAGFAVALGVPGLLCLFDAFRDHTRTWQINHRPKCFTFTLLSPQGRPWLRHPWIAPINQALGSYFKAADWVRLRLMLRWVLPASMLAPSLALLAMKAAPWFGFQAYAWTLSHLPTWLTFKVVSVLGLSFSPQLLGVTAAFALGLAALYALSALLKVAGMTLKAYVLRHMPVSVDANDPGVSGRPKGYEFRDVLADCLIKLGDRTAYAWPCLAVLWVLNVFAWAAGAMRVALGQVAHALTVSQKVVEVAAAVVASLLLAYVFVGRLVAWCVTVVREPFRRAAVAKDYDAAVDHNLAVYLTDLLDPQLNPTKEQQGDKALEPYRELGRLFFSADKTTRLAQVAAVLAAGRSCIKSSKALKADGTASLGFGPGNAHATQLGRFLLYLDQITNFEAVRKKALLIEYACCFNSQHMPYTKQQAFIQGKSLPALRGWENMKLALDNAFSHDSLVEAMGAYTKEVPAHELLKSALVPERCRQRALVKALAHYLQHWRHWRWSLTRGHKALCKDILANHSPSNVNNSKPQPPSLELYAEVCAHAWAQELGWLGKKVAANYQITRHTDKVHANLKMQLAAMTMADLPGNDSLRLENPAEKMVAAMEKRLLAPTWWLLTRVARAFESLQWWFHKDPFSLAMANHLRNNIFNMAPDMWAEQSDAMNRFFSERSPACDSNANLVALLGGVDATNNRPRALSFPEGSSSNVSPESEPAARSAELTSGEITPPPPPASRTSGDNTKGCESIADEGNKVIDTSHSIN